MEVRKEMKIADINSAFSQLYPHLKLGFYKKEHDHFEGSEPKFEYGQDATLGSINPEMAEGKIPHFGEMSVDEFEQKWQDLFGLHVQVFRKSGEVWLQTSKTDFWTLNKQEEKAK